MDGSPPRFEVRAGHALEGTARVDPHGLERRWVIRMAGGTLVGFLVAAFLQSTALFGLFTVMFALLGLGMLMGWAPDYGTPKDFVLEPHRLTVGRKSIPLGEVTSVERGHQVVTTSAGGEGGTTSAATLQTLTLRAQTREKAVLMFDTYHSAADVDWMAEQLRARIRQGSDADVPESLQEVRAPATRERHTE